MARRMGQPEHIRRELPLRARAGAGHDSDYPTPVGATVIPALQARRTAPSPHMLDTVAKVTGYLASRGAEHIDVRCDMRDEGAPGSLTVLWIGHVPAAEVAKAFAVSAAEDGTPLIPSWLNLRAEHDFDLRWQPPY